MRRIGAFNLVVGAVVLATVAGCETERRPESGLELHDRRKAEKPPPPLLPPRIDMIQVPGGEFRGAQSRCLPGTFTARADHSPDDHHHGVRQRIETYRIDRDVVSCDDFQRCVAAGRCTGLERCDRIIANVSLAQAKEYCAWRNARLPSLAEWQRAARGTDGQVYPTGDTWTSSCASSYDGNLRCPFTSELGFTYAVRNLNGGEWTREFDCYKDSSEWQLAPLIVVLLYERLNVHSFAAPDGRNEFRCALPLTNDASAKEGA